MATPFAAKGTLIKKGITAVVDVFDFDWSGMEHASAETTNLDDVADTFVTTTYNSGELSFSIMYDPADVTHQALFTDLLDGSIDAYTLNLSNAGADSIGGNAFVKSLSVNGSTKEKVVLRCTLKFTGALTPAS